MGISEKGRFGVHRVPTGQGKLENVGEFVVSGKCRGKMLFLKSQGK